MQSQEKTFLLFQLKFKGEPTSQVPNGTGLPLQVVTNDPGLGGHQTFPLTWYWKETLPSEEFQVYISLNNTPALTQPLPFGYQIVRMRLPLVNAC